MTPHGGAVGWTDPTCGYFDSRPACSKCGRFVAYRDVEVVAYHPASGWNGEVIDGHSSHPVCGSGVPVNDVFRWVATIPRPRRQWTRKDGSLYPVPQKVWHEDRDGFGWQVDVTWPAEDPS